MNTTSRPKLTRREAKLLVACDDALDALTAVFNAEVSAGNEDFDDVKDIKETLDRVADMLKDFR